MDERSTLQEQKGITRITVAGYKSIAEEQSIEIRPLTILAGANSSGKSSIMQPLLLLKQTLEATYDPGPLLLSGPNVKFTSVDQLLFRSYQHAQTDAFSVGIGVEPNTLESRFYWQANKGLKIQQSTQHRVGEQTNLKEAMTHDEIMSGIPSVLRDTMRAIPSVLMEEVWGGSGDDAVKELKWSVVRKRCLLDLELKAKERSIRLYSPADFAESPIRQLVHLPGLRGNPERAYPVTAVGSVFPGTFEKYTASVIAHWQADGDLDQLEKLTDGLRKLGLNWTITARRINDTQVELQVGRIAHTTGDRARDLVNIADVGFGVSQTLPGVVALCVAKPNQLVYLEQPEIHLHPRAQVAMAQILADAAQRGVRVVAETHSALLLLGVQSLVAEGQLSPELVKLHWFAQREDGTTEITSADLDETGAFGDWPEDFGQVELVAESRYLDAVESHYQER